MLLVRGAPRDRPRALELLDETLAAADRYAARRRAGVR
jgi:hypothetical protein